MDQLNGLSAFVKTADLGSFVAAGRVLGLSASAVGKAVTTLERQVGVRLFQRSTRSIRLTEEGRLFHERCRRVLDDLEDARPRLPPPSPPRAVACASACRWSATICCCLSCLASSGSIPRSNSISISTTASST
jgi:DNA-binding transcriptional LysR family regulator